MRLKAESAITKKSRASNTLNISRILTEMCFKWHYHFSSKFGAAMSLKFSRNSKCPSFRVLNCFIIHLFPNVS